MKYHYLILFLIPLFFYSCKGSTPRTFPTSVEIINIEQAFNNPISDFSKFIDSSKIVALKAPKKYMQGEITKATLYKDKIITFDELNSKRVNVYNFNGEFLFSVCEIGRGPKEAVNISDFSVSNDSIYIVDPVKRKVLIFSLNNGEYINSMQLPFGALEFHKIQANKFLFVLTDYNVALGDNYLTNTCVVTDSLYAPVSFGGKHPAANECETHTRSHWNTAYGSSFYSMYNETIYKYDQASDSLLPYISFDFGKDNVSTEDLADINRYMSFFDKSSRTRFTTDSPIFINDCTFAIIKRNNKKYFFISQNNVGYTREISTNDYKLNYPYFIVGQGDDNTTLISIVQHLDREKELEQMGVDMSGDINHVLLFSKTSRSHQSN